MCLYGVCSLILSKPHTNIKRYVLFWAPSLLDSNTTNVNPHLI